MATKLPQLPEVERISPRVIRILGGNPGKFTLQGRYQLRFRSSERLTDSVLGTNTYLVGQGPKRILIDTGEGKPAWLNTLKKILSDENASLDQVIVTHWHPDHIGGVKDVKTLSPTPKIYKNQPNDGMSDISDGQKFFVEGSTLRAFHSPGHTTDHMALILEEEDAMFTGDNILGHGTAVFEDLQTYLDSLQRMSTAVSGRGYPGHGDIIEKVRAKAEEYIAHRAQREREVIGVIGSEENGIALMDMVKVIYKDVPENLHLPASKGVQQILWKLQDEGKLIHNSDNDTWKLQEKAAL
jgi:glyoxylase-like metal-dependent hydrolase (beta-lactamase superfamily II)